MLSRNVEKTDTLPSHWFPALHMSPPAIKLNWVSCYSSKRTNDAPYIHNSALHLLILKLCFIWGPVKTSPSADTFLLMYEFEALTKLKDQRSESVLERALTLPSTDPKLFHILAGNMGQESAFILLSNLKFYFTGINFLSFACHKLTLFLLLDFMQPVHLVYGC